MAHCSHTNIQFCGDANTGSTNNQGCLSRDNGEDH